MAVQTKKIKYYGGDFLEESDLRNKKDKENRETEKPQTLSKTTKLPEAAQLCGRDHITSAG